MKKLISLIAIVFLVIGCAKYKGGRLPSIDVDSFANSQDQEGLKVAVKFYDARDSKQLFGLSCVHDKYQPVYIVIDNRTSNTFEFKKRMVSKASAPAEEVAEVCKFNTAGRAAGYGAAGLVIWPMLIPAVVDGMGSANANERMQDDMMYKEIKDERILPNGVLNGILFLDKIKDGEDFAIRIRDVGNEQIKLFSFTK